MPFVVFKLTFENGRAMVVKITLAAFTKQNNSFYTKVLYFKEKEKVFACNINILGQQC